MYWMVCWLLPLAVLVRLGFTVFVFLGLKCECAADEADFSSVFTLFGQDLQPVQYIVIASSTALSLPILFFLAREVAALRQSARTQRRDRRALHAAQEGAEGVQMCIAAPSAASPPSPFRLQQVDPPNASPPVASDTRSARTVAEAADALDAAFNRDPDTDDADDVDAAAPDAHDAPNPPDGAADDSGEWDETAEAADQMPEDKLGAELTYVSGKLAAESVCSRRSSTHCRPSAASGSARLSRWAGAGAGAAGTAISRMSSAGVHVQEAVSSRVSKAEGVGRRVSEIVALAVRPTEEAAYTTGGAGRPGGRSPATLRNAQQPARIRSLSRGNSLRGFIAGRSGRESATSCTSTSTPRAGAIDTYAEAGGCRGTPRETPCSTPRDSARGSPCGTPRHGATARFSRTSSLQRGSRTSSLSVSRGVLPAATSGGLGRSRASTATSSHLPRNLLPEISQMYLPPLTQRIMEKLVVDNPVRCPCLLALLRPSPSFSVLLRPSPSLPPRGVVALHGMPSTPARSPPPYVRRCGCNGSRWRRRVAARAANAGRCARWRRTASRRMQEAGTSCPRPARVPHAHKWSSSGARRGRCRTAQTCAPFAAQPPAQLVAHCCRWPSPRRWSARTARAPALSEMTDAMTSCTVESQYKAHAPGFDR